MFRGVKNHHDVLGIPDTRETGPADVGAVGEERNEVLGFGELGQVRGPLDTASEQSRRSHCDDEGRRDDKTRKKETSGDGPRKRKIWGLGKENQEKKRRREREEKEKRKRERGI